MRCTHACHLLDGVIHIESLSFCGAVWTKLYINKATIVADVLGLSSRKRKRGPADIGNGLAFVVSRSTKKLFGPPKSCENAATQNATVKSDWQSASSLHLEP